MMLALDPGALALARFELERELKQVGVQPQSAVQLSHHLVCLETLRPLIPHHPAHQHAVSVRPKPGSCSGMRASG
jgi:hypothetical protein